LKTQAGTPAVLVFTLVGSALSPVLNSAIVVKGWRESNVTLTMNGKQIPRGKGFRFGHLQTLEGTDLVGWIKTETRAPLTFGLTPESQP